jgi:hypothetical protein
MVRSYKLHHHKQSSRSPKQYFQSSSRSVILADDLLHGERPMMTRRGRSFGQAAGRRRKPRACRRAVCHPEVGTDFKQYLQHMLRSQLA